MMIGITKSVVKRQRMIFFSSQFLFCTVMCQGLVKNKAKLRTLHSCWPLNRGKNNRENLIGMAKRSLVVCQVVKPA